MLQRRLLFFAAWVAAGTLLPLTGMEALPANALSPDSAVLAQEADAGMRLVKLGLLAEENRDPAAAANYLSRALAYPLPASLRRTVLETLHENLLQLQNFTKAEELEQSSGTLPDFKAYPERLAWMEARRLTAVGNREAALAKLRSIQITPRPGDDECRRSEELLARAFNAAGDYQTATARFEALITSAGINGEWKLRALEGALLNALDAGQPAEAQKYLTRIQTEVPTVERDANAKQIHSLEWLIKAASGQFAEIAPDFRKAAAKTPSRPDPVLARIAILGAESAPKDAPERIEWWQYAYQLADDALRPAALQNLIRAQNDLGKWEDALQSIAAYFELFPTSPERWKLRIFEAEINLKLQRNEAALTIYESVLNDNSAAAAERSLAAEALAGLHQKAGRSTEAIACLQKAIGMATGGRRETLTQALGEYLYLLARYDEARSLLTPLAEHAQTPEAGEKAALWVVQCDYQLKAINPALTRCEKLMNAKSPEVQRKARYLSALLLEKSGRIEEAAARYREFAEAFPQADEAAEALFQAGELSIGAPDQRAAEIFLRYAKLYHNENAANALYKAHGELLFAGKSEAAESALAQLDQEYPESKFTVAANFRKVDFLRDAGQPEAALAALTHIDERHGKKNADLHAEILYDQALLYDALHDTPKALKSLEEVTQSYADRPIAAQSYLLLGDLHMRANDFEAAATCFRQAEERKPHAELAAVCTGRAADAAYALYGKTQQDSYLAQALNGYETLLKSPTLSPAMRFQTTYKLGRVAEDSGDPSRALALYGEVLYRAVLAHRENAFYAPVWCAKSLDAALALLRPAETDAPTAEEREALRAEAIRLLELAAELDLPVENIPARLERLRAGAPMTEQKP